MGALRVGAASHLFLVRADLAPLIVLAVGLSGRNGETIKELPTEHRVLEDRAVAVTVVKRRRGKALSRETVHWEIGASENRQLHLSGGFYLLLHQLTARSRQFSGTPSGLWQIYTGRRAILPDGTQGPMIYGHVDPFRPSLSIDYKLQRWLRIPRDQCVGSVSQNG